MHLVNNLISLFIAGLLVVAMIGNLRFLAVYLLSGLAGSIASVLMHPMIVSVGASGAIFGLFGLLLVFVGVGDRAIIGQRGGILRFVLLFIGLNLAIGFLTPSVDNAAHIGGLIAGALLGLVFHFEHEFRPASVSGFLGVGSANAPEDD